MKLLESANKKHAGRRSFLKRGGVGVAGTANLSSGFLINGISALGEDRERGGLRKGDAAILSFLAAAEILESDLWEQYWELGGTQDNEFAKATGGEPLYTGALTL